MKSGKPFLLNEFNQTHNRKETSFRLKVIFILIYKCFESKTKYKINENYYFLNFLHIFRNINKNKNLDLLKANQSKLTTKKRIIKQ